MDRTDLNEFIARWRRRVETTLRKVENRRRQYTNRKPFPKDCIVLLPNGRRADMQLLTLRTWTIRFGVPLDFVLDVLTKHYEKVRKIKSNETLIRLGMPLNMLTGPQSRRILIQAVHRTYPTNENWRMLVQPKIRIPSNPLDLDDPDAALKAYTQNIEKTRATFDLLMKRNEKSPQRVFRRTH